MKFSKKTRILLSALFISTPSFADLPADIGRASEDQILVAGKKMAEGLAQNAPAQIDRTTILRGGIFVNNTKTVIYKYESSIPLDQEKMYSYIRKQMCLDPIKLAFMKRGIRYRHDYTTPASRRQ